TSASRESRLTLSLPSASRKSVQQCWCVLDSFDTRREKNPRKGGAAVENLAPAGSDRRAPPRSFRGTRESKRRAELCLSIRAVEMTRAMMEVTTRTSYASQQQDVQRMRLVSVGNYETTRLLGRGNFARVVEAVHSVLKAKKPPLHCLLNAEIRDRLFLFAVLQEYIYCAFPEIRPDTEPMPRPKGFVAFINPPYFPKKQ
ncbi:hypothetical protein TSAR_015893, partial [Trichomalopsis sarcophagae]